MPNSRRTTRTALVSFLVSAFALAANATVTARHACAQSPGSSMTAPNALASRIDAIVSRPEYRHAFFGIEIFSLDTHDPIYQLNADKFFVPGSTTKLLTEGTVLELLGPDHRFRTRVYRTGPVRSDGTLDGNLVLVAAGDPDLSNRVQPDGSLAFENEDHSYGGSPDTRAVPGDPLLVLRELARQVRQHGIRAVHGSVIVDASLFPEGDRELGTDVVISPIVVNDNVVDVTVAPGKTPGDSVTLRVSPETPYVTFVNRATTSVPDSSPNINWASDSSAADGSHIVTVTGTVPAGKPGILFSWPVDEPTRFAEVSFARSLGAEGVRASAIAPTRHVDMAALARGYADSMVVAEHVSPPLSEEVKVTLKVSQNLHASMGPFLLGSLLAHQGTAKAGFGEERRFLKDAGLDLSGASQSDGAGGSAHFTPDFMVHFLAYMATRKDFPLYYASLPVLGRDGTLWNIQVNSPAAGHVHAKTGTYERDDLLNDLMMVDGKGLAGYMTTADGRRLAFAVYANNVAAGTDPEAITRGVGQALGEIAAAAYGIQP
ncbi:MAG TPA: D-alanyl-D-alanine carboxypeptidase/D-alanyl-D-alanine-endopeptidase [Gemmatimonadaceae bacterium]|nr:D-alanyl-D-alanine carboxypeptidase/D-alanyl-D-alanine-endopeptidase [Gemmatimonadaceae bacterium]